MLTMTRLTNEMRDAIVRNAMKKTDIEKRREAYDKKYKAWCERVYLFSVGGRPALDKFKKLHAQITELQKGIPVDLREYSMVSGFSFDRGVDLNVGGRSFRIAFDESRIAPGGRVNILGDHKLCAQFLDLRAELDEIKGDEQTARAKVSSAVHSVNTVKQLLKVWPEAEELLSPTTPKPVAKLPALPVEELNKTFKLPSKK